MKTTRQTIVATVTAAAVLAAGGAWAGDLTPPGAPGATMHTLEEIYQEVASRQAADGRIQISQADLASPPYVITNSGSYVLTENLVITNTGVNGINVQADNVTIDLNGFNLQGPGAGVAGNGILQMYTGTIPAVTSLHDGLTVCNGGVIGWGSSPAAYESGIFAFGSNNRFEGITASHNLIGILGGSVVLECNAYSNTMIGMLSLDACVIRNCSAQANGGDGIHVGGYATTISHCSALTNGGDGIVINGAGSVGSFCAARYNGGHGIHIGSGGNALVSCTARQNTGDGIFSEGSGGTIKDCAARDNAGDGIEVEHQNLVVGNMCQGNGSGAGIHVVGGGSRIEGNNVTVNARGIDVDAGGNIVVRNSAHGNSTNYDIGANNAYGPVVGVAGVGDMSGTANADHPWANFAF